MARTKPEIKKVNKKPLFDMPDSTGFTGTWDRPKPKPWLRPLFTIVQWLAIGTCLYFAFFGFHFRFQLPATKPMPGELVVLFGLSAAYVWVDVLKWGVVKPFNCLTCLSGWFCLILAFVFHTHYWYLYLPLGAFAGGLYSSVKMRWL